MCHRVYADSEGPDQPATIQMRCILACARWNWICAFWTCSKTPFPLTWPICFKVRRWFTLRYFFHLKIDITIAHWSALLLGIYFQLQIDTTILVTFTLKCLFSLKIDTTICYLSVNFALLYFCFHWKMDSTFCHLLVIFEWPLLYV